MPPMGFPTPIGGLSIPIRINRIFIQVFIPDKLLADQRNFP